MDAHSKKRARVESNDDNDMYHTQSHSQATAPPGDTTLPCDDPPDMLSNVGPIAHGTTPACIKSTVDLDSKQPGQTGTPSTTGTSVVKSNTSSVHEKLGDDLGQDYWLPNALYAALDRAPFELGNGRMTEILDKAVEDMFELVEIDYYGKRFVDFTSEEAREHEEYVWAGSCGYWRPGQAEREGMDMTKWNE